MMRFQDTQFNHFLVDIALLGKKYLKIDSSLLVYLYLLRGLFVLLLRFLFLELEYWAGPELSMSSEITTVT